MTMHLHINNPNLEKQLEKFAKEEGQTAEVLATDVLQRHVEYKERYAKEKIEDEQRWQRYLDTGECISQEQMSLKIKSLIGEAKAKIK